jgi:murein DD-endopeptidase MepM/ murein hydrolase activator NlpD
MHSHLTRVVAPLLVAALAVGVTDALVHPTPAAAAVDTEQQAFVMEVFPNDTAAVNFWDSWDARRSGGRRHKGIDILAPRGTEVLAVADGVVADFGEQRLSGYFVRIDHGGGWTSTYMHLNNDTVGTDDGLGGIWTAIYPTLTIGTEVRAGDVIGYVGDSGNAEGTQPHTHFELRFEGTKVNPYPALRDAWERSRRLSPPLQLL